MTKKSCAGPNLTGVRPSFIHACALPVGSCSTRVSVRRESVVVSSDVNMFGQRSVFVVTRTTCTMYKYIGARMWRRMTLAKARARHRTLGSIVWRRHEHSARSNDARETVVRSTTRLQYSNYRYVSVRPTLGMTVKERKKKHTNALVYYTYARTT